VDVSLLVLRLAAGSIFFAHGAQKVLGVWGGPGLSETVRQMELGPLGYLVAFGEFLGGIGLIFGFLTRFSAAALIVIMVGAIVMVHGKNGFLLQNGGYEYNLALIALLLPIFLMGPGRLAVIRFLKPKSKIAGTVIE
jgi:putative oxidoreductase